MNQVKIVRIVVASPSDVQAERDALPAIVEELNKIIAADRGLGLELSRWETDAYPGFHSEGPQGLIDSILHIEDCDLLIGIFWKRFGTPVKEAKSGTEHEFKLAYEAWKQKGHPEIMVYFNQKSYTPKSKEETDQWGQVLEFQRQYPKEGLWWPYKGKTQFEGLVRSHLTNFIRKRFPIHAQVDTDANVVQQSRKAGGYRINGDHWQRAIVRVWKGIPTRGGEWLGTAFLISPTHAVTAAHVIKQAAEGIFLSGMAWSGVRWVEQILHHPNRDVAMLTLVKSESAQICLGLARKPLEISDRITVAGYSTPDKDLESPTLEVESYDGEHHVFVLNIYKGPGLSGGPALRDGKLVGIIQARDMDRNRTYVIPLDAFRDFLIVACPYELESESPGLRDRQTTNGDTGSTAVIADGSYSNPYDPWNPVTPPRFFGRKALLQRLETALEEGRSVSLVGDWRIGKSSVLLTWKQRAEAKGRMVRSISGEGAEAASPGNCVRAITGFDVGDDPDQAANGLSQWAIQISPPGLPPLILIDEVEAMVIAFPHRFFERLRGMLGRICLVLSSRRELDQLYAELGRTSPFHNRLELARLGLLEPDVADQLIALGKPFFRQGDEELLRNWAGRHPFYLQLLGRHLVGACRQDENSQEALDRFLDEATARLRELWRILSLGEQEALRAALIGKPVQSRKLRQRGLLTEEGRLFGEVLTQWLRDES